MSEQQKTIGQLMRRIRNVLILRSFANWAMIWCFVWGTLVLVLRTALGIWHPSMVLGILGVVPAVALAMAQARKQMPSEAAVCAELDRQGGLGGFLMAQQETGLGRWRQKIPAVPQLSVRWDGRRSFGMLACAIGFAVISFLLPQRFVSHAYSAPLDITDQSHQLNRQIDLLIEEKVIDQDDADAYRKVLKKIEEQARAEDPVKTWEALDHLRKNLQERADLSAESSLSEASKLEEVKALSEALRQDQSDTAPQIDPQVTAESLKHLRKSVEQRMAANELFHLLASQNIDLDRLSASDLDQGAKRLPQVFLDQTLDAKDIERARKVLDRLRVEPRQLGLLDPQAFQSLKEAVARRKQNPRLLEQVRRELAEKLTDQRPEGGKLDAEQIKRIEQALREAGLDPKRMAFLDADLAQPPGGEVPQRPPQLRQVFFSDQLTEETRVEAIQLATLMFIPDAQMGILNHEALQVLRRASEDGRIETQEIEPILEDLEPHLFEAGVLPPVPEGWMEPFGQKLKLLGLKNDQFLLLDQSSSQCQGSQSLVRLTPEQLRQLQQIAEASGQGQSALADRLQRLADNGLIDPSRLKEMQNAGSITPEQLRQWLAEHGKGLSISQLIRNASRPGRGGVNRGRGDAPMHWKDPTSSEGATFKARALPQAQLEALRKSKLVGVSVGKHKTPTGSKPATSSQALDQTKSEGGSAQQHLILPRHRGVVREYFRRGETSKPPSRLNP